VIPHLHGEDLFRAEAITLAYDVFVVHAAADESFVQGYLLPELGLPAERVLVPRTLMVGRPLIEEIERGVRSSRVTLVVLSPAYMVDQWAAFGEQLAAYASVARDAHGEMLPLLLEDCELPAHIRALVMLDFRDPARKVWTAEIARLRRYFDRPIAAEQSLPCPYPGMRPFTEQDAQWFFGRDAELDDILRRLRRGEREIYVIGASGSGKSSLITAGLAPRLTSGVPGLPDFLVRTLRPGELPLARLGEVLGGNPADPVATIDQLLALHAATSLLLVIDQLEELFAVARDDERLGFLAAVRVLRADPRCVLMFTLRADFYGAFMESTLWNDVDGRISRIELGAVSRDNLRMIIERPAGDVGVYFQPELVWRLVEDAAREPGALPLLQETLFQLWGKRRRRLLVLADYQSLSDGPRTGLAFAIREHADAVLRTLTRAQETIALRLLLRLVQFGEGRADTRRQQPRAALRSQDEASDFDTVLQHLADNRLVTVTGDDQRGDVRVDLAHEILIQAWSAFTDWIRTWRVPEQRRRELEATAAAWRARGSGDGGLLDKLELANAVEWRAAAVDQLGHSTDLTALLSASRVAHARAIRQRRRIVSAALAPVLVIGTLAVVNIIVERNLARAAEHRAELRAEALTLAQARSEVEHNPTRAVAMLKPLAAKYWRVARATAAAARASGVAWGLPASKHTRSLEISHDGLHALSAGNDGVIRLHDLAGRTTRAIADLGTPVKARFADGARQIVTWHAAQIAILDARTAARRDLATAHPIAELEVVGTTVYWVDDCHALWKLELAGAGAAPERVPLQVPVHRLAPSPSGRWIALAGDDHLYLYDRAQPTPSVRRLAMGTVQQLAWSDDGEDLVALFVQQPSDRQVFVVTMSPEPTIIHRRMAHQPELVALAAGHIYVVGDSGIAILERDDTIASTALPSFRELSGAPVGLAVSCGGTVVAGATGGITMISEDGDHVLLLQGARIEGIAASPRSPYVIAQLDGRLLVWNLDEIQPHRLSDMPPCKTPTCGALFATADRVIVGGSEERQALSIDVAGNGTGNVAGRAVQLLGEWQGLTAVTAPVDGHVAAIVDGERHVHLVAPGLEPEQLPGEIDIAGFATATTLVLATLDGSIYVHDLERHQRMPVIEHRSHLLGLATGRGRPPWIAAVFVDGTLWRKNLITGAVATTARVPPLTVDPARGDGKPPLREGKLIASGDGAVLFVHDSEVHAWRADGSLARLTRTPRPIEDFGEAGPAQIVTIAGDRTIYTSARDVADQVAEEVPSIDGTSAMTSPDTGMFVVLDHGALKVIDPLARQTWTLAPAAGVTFSHPAISADGRRVLAQTAARQTVQIRTYGSLLVWSLDLPAGPDATVRWLDEMTNAVEGPGPARLDWR
jgi:hypothetical protein